MIRGINHITISVSDLEKSIEFYSKVFGAKLLVKGHKVGERLAYFDLKGIWLALNVEDSISRKDIYESYSHISFTIDEDEYESYIKRLKNLNINLIEGRPRDKQEGKSIYFRDPDGHLFELHTKTLEDRIDFLKKNKPSLSFYI